MLGTDDVAIVYHISTTTADGWLADGSDTASKPRRQQAVSDPDVSHETIDNFKDSAARPAWEMGTADGCTPSRKY